jgi:hypothetical protein
MYARVTLLEIDTVRVDMDDAVELFEQAVLPELRERPGYRGVYVLTTPEGKALLLTLWESADAATDSVFYPAQLEKYATLFRAPPGRERYRVSLVDAPVHAA